MIHQPLGGAQGQASDIEITAREILKTKRELYEILSVHSGVSVKKIEKDADRDYWLSAREAKDYGLIDEVLSKRQVKRMAQNKNNKHGERRRLLLVLRRQAQGRGDHVPGFGRREYL